MQMITNKKKTCLWTCLQDHLNQAQCHMYSLSIGQLKYWYHADQYIMFVQFTTALVSV